MPTTISGTTGLIFGDGTTLSNAKAVISRVFNLTGNVNATTPLTKFDLKADAVVLRNAAGSAIGVYSGATLTCDLGLVGPAANGRDQSAAFAVSTWVNLFYVWNGTALALIASTASHTTGPVLPAGYTHWAYATTILWNASSNIYNVRVRGDTVSYNSQSYDQRVVVASVTATFSTVSCASWVPPNHVRAMLAATISCTHSVVAVFYGALRTTGTITEINIASCVVPVASGSTFGVGNLEIQLNASQQIDHRINAAPNGGGGLYIDVLGYSVPNGDV